MGELWSAVGMPTEDAYILFVPDGVHKQHCRPELLNAMEWLSKNVKPNNGKQVELYHGWTMHYRINGTHTISGQWDLLELMHGVIQDYVVQWGRA